MLKTAGLIAVTIAIGLALIWWFQRRLIYFPLQSTVPPARTVLPGAREVSFVTDDGLRLGGWFLPAAEGSPAASVLVCNGNAGNRAARAPLAAALSRRGLSVLLFDYRGYGGNPGRPSEKGLIRDALAAIEWLEREIGDGGRIVYYGESLGSAVALGAAVERPPAAMILRSPFTSLADLGRLHYPFLPVGLMLVDRYASIDRIRELDAPLLVIAGGRDRIVPPAQSRALFEAAAGADKRFASLPQADHNDWDLLAGERMLEEITEFLVEVAGIGARPEPSSGP